jgi:riboflavin kinase/FMN adenylyltransferase
MRKSVVAIGNFDGVHVGHRDLLMHAKALAKKSDMGLTVLTFTPHPRRVFQPNIAPFRITPDTLKENIIKRDIGIDHYIALDFNAAFMAKTADEFMDDILVGQCNAGIVVVGQDFQFGNNRTGTIDTLRQNDAFETVPYDLMHIDDLVVSSSRIRNHLKAAQMNQANALLGWEWFTEGEVVHGDKRGRELGYPTANMHFGETIVPDHGIYAVRVMIEGETAWRTGAANIGIRPMFETRVPMLETYIFDFDADIYGKILKIMPVQKIRDEMKFDNLDDLIKQMDKDCKQARNILQSS